MITKSRATRSADAIRPLAIISRQLETYAQRGVFRSFSQGEDEREFFFYWLWNLPFRLTYDGKRNALSFSNLFPNIVAGSGLETELKAFIRELSSPRRRRHRRLDPRRTVARYINRQNTGSLVFLIAGKDYEYAVQRALNSVHEVFVGFLNLRYPEYMRESFHVSDDI